MENSIPPGPTARLPQGILCVGSVLPLGWHKLFLIPPEPEPSLDQLLVREALAGVGVHLKGKLGADQGSLVTGVREMVWHSWVLPHLDTHLWAHGACLRICQHQRSLSGVSAAAPCRFLWARLRVLGISSGNL